MGRTPISRKRQKPPLVQRKFTKQARERVLKALAAGCHRVTAAGYAGIHETTLSRWVSFGDDQHPDYKGPKTAWVQFHSDVNRAEHEAEVNAVAKVRSEGFTGEVKFLAWWLERRHKARWGQKVTLAGDPSAPLQTATSPAVSGDNLTDDQKAELERLLTKAIGDGPTDDEEE